MKTILITGGNGLVGSAIKSVTSDYDYSVFEEHKFIYLNREECNLTNYCDTINSFMKYKPNYVIHLAANVGGLFKNMEQPVQMLEDNLLINMNVVKASHEVGVDKLVACLSTCIFPDIVNYPITEKDLHNGPPHHSNAAYAYSKRILETLCESYRKQYGDNFICVVPTNIYGQFDNFNLKDAHVIPSLIHKCYLAKESGTDFIVSGSGKPLRQFIYSKDLAKMIMMILLDYDEKETIILSPNENDEVSIEYVARRIAKEFDYETRIIFDTTQADGQYRKPASNEKFMKKNPYFEFTSFEKGLHETVQWFKNRYPNIRK